MAEINPPSFLPAAPSAMRPPETGNQHLAELCQQTHNAPRLGSHTLTHSSIASSSANLSTNGHKCQKPVSDTGLPENKLSKYRIKSEHCLSNLFSWDFFSPSPTLTNLWAFPVSGQTGHSPASSTITQVLPGPASQPTLRLRLPQQTIVALPDWREFQPNLNNALYRLFQHLPNNTNGQDPLSITYRSIYQFSLLRSGGISQEDVLQLNDLIQRADAIWQNNPQMPAAEDLRNLSYLLRGICFAKKCYNLLTTLHSDRNPEKRCQRLMAELIQLDPNNRVLTKWREAISAIQSELQPRQLPHSMPHRLTQRPEVPPASTPQSIPQPILQGAIGGIDISNRPSREALYQETERLMKASSIVANSLGKIDQHAADGREKYRKLESELQRLNEQIKQKSETFHRHYGPEIKHQIQHWHSAAMNALATEGSATLSGLQQLQAQIESAIDEIELFFDQETHRLCQYIWNQLTDALNRSQSRENFLRVREWLQSDQPIMPNQVRPGDDLPLYFLFQQRKQDLESQALIVNMAELSDQEREQTKANIIKITKELDRIIALFRTIIYRYERLKSGHQYPHQIAEMEEASRKGHRVIATETSQKIQERLKLINTLQDPSIDTNHLLDMSDEDFQLIITLLGGKPLTEEHRKTMANNSWQLTEKNHLVTQRGHERVTVVSIGNMYRLIDTASNTPIGTLDRIRWERIHKRLEREGLKGANNITRQMVIDDFRNFPTTEAQWQAQRAERLGGIPDSLRQQGEEVVVPKQARYKRPEDPSVTSEILRYQRRHFQKP
ncbi:hypothetical protein [Endozoicomonas sp. SCSIO W0465]|uniref:hypothetical protein n=1 Tax=Endozoicomonas sp. SCSIO W0465 TaxID=2918516 RepID=UPI0020766085|nr:hypothetical protein [Endozoicomonas sp. SCSIO W0465]USE35028.1 hypothetical protein MJO57_23360 [Endozoicomonas sp. SCSIO W0465]